MERRREFSNEGVGEIDLPYVVGRRGDKVGEAVIEGGEMKETS